MSQLKVTPQPPTLTAAQKLEKDQNNAAGFVVGETQHQICIFKDLLGKTHHKTKKGNTIEAFDKDGNILYSITKNKDGSVKYNYKAQGQDVSLTDFDNNGIFDDLVIVNKNNNYTIRSSANSAGEFTVIHLNEGTGVLEKRNGIVSNIAAITLGILCFPIWAITQGEHPKSIDKRFSVTTTPNTDNYCP